MGETEENDMNNEETREEQAAAQVEEASEGCQDSAAAEQSGAETVETLREKLREAIALQEEYLEFCKRERADFENYKRRTRSESLEQYDAGRMRVIEDMLPIIDSMESAAAMAKDDATKQGVQLMLKQVTSLLEKWGVSEIDRQGEPFDPHMENAVMTGEPGEGTPGSVLAVLRKGYRLGAKVLRIAMVKVAAE